MLQRSVETTQASPKEETPMLPVSGCPVKRSKFWGLFQECESVLVEREQEFKGSADGQFKDIGELASLMAGEKITAKGVAAMFLALKLIRMRANPEHEDSARDAINYLAFFSEISKLAKDYVEINT